MKRHKVGPVGIVVSADAIRAVQLLDGRVVAASVPGGENLKKSLRQLLSSAPFVGRNVVIGLEGHTVLVESIVLPPGTSKEARKICADRLKGDPLFSSEKAVLGVAVDAPPGVEGATAQTLAIMAAMNKERLVEVMKACREIELDVTAVEAAALACWRAFQSEGLAVRLVRSAGHDIVLAGSGEKLLFCRIVESPVAIGELRATIGRAASLLGAEGFPQLVVAGMGEEARSAISAGLGMEVVPPPGQADDPAAIGLATEGPVVADFTPAEERVLRERRRTRKVAIQMAAVCAALLLGAGVLGTRRVSTLGDEGERLRRELAAVQAERAQLDQLRADIARESANENVITSARPGHRLSTLFALVASRVGESISLDNVKVTDAVDPAVQASAASGPVRRFLDVRLNGVARSGLAVRQFADALLATNAFSDVRVEASERVLLGVGLDGERFRIYARAETH